MVRAALMSSIINSNSEVEFITEHYWGYAKVSENETNEYEVTHPRWEHHPIDHFEIKVNFEAVYGSEFEFLNRMNPNSVILANGSEITVENKT